MADKQSKKAREAAPKIDKRATLKVTVEFNEDYISSRGPGIAGREGDVATFPWTPDLQKLIDDEVVEVKKKVDSNKKSSAKSSQASGREKATT